MDIQKECSSVSIDWMQTKGSEQMTHTNIQMHSKSKKNSDKMSREGSMLRCGGDNDDIRQSDRQTDKTEW